MTRDEILAILRTHQHELREYHLRSLALFGSASRNEAGPDSDVDVLVEFDVTPGLFKLIQLENELSDLLGVKVDLVLKGSLKPRIRERVLAEAIVV